MRLDEGRNRSGCGRKKRVGWLVLERLGEEVPQDLLDLTPKENMNSIFHNSALAVKKMKFVSFLGK